MVSLDATTRWTSSSSQLTDRAAMIGPEGGVALYAGVNFYCQNAKTSGLGMEARCAHMAAVEVCNLTMDWAHIHDVV